MGTALVWPLLLLRVARFLASMMFTLPCLRTMPGSCLERIGTLQRLHGMEKGMRIRGGQPVEPTKIHDAWLYVGNKPVICSRQEEVAALVSSINFAISPSLDSLEVGSMQQELLWMLYVLGHLDKYPMAL